MDVMILMCQTAQHIKIIEIPGVRLGQHYFNIKTIKVIQIIKFITLI